MPIILNIDGTYNIRDLGGFSVGDGQVTASRVFIRAGNLDKVTPSAQQKLIDYGVTTVIDLRNEWEVESYPNVFAQSNKVTFQNLPLVGNKLSDDEAWKQLTKDYESLGELYCKYLDTCQPQIGKIISTIADSRATTIFHCYAGKDRTGIISALVLSVMGVSEEDIAHDYAESKSHLTHLYKKWRDYATQNELDLKRVEIEIESEASSMLEMLSYIKNQFGSVADYLKICGVTEAHIQKLQSHTEGKS